MILELEVCRRALEKERHAKWGKIKDRVESISTRWMELMRMD